MQGVLSLSPPNLRSNSFCIRWTAKATDLVELLYALDTCDCINDGEIGVEELAYVLSVIFGVEIKNCYNVYMNMKRRKDDSRTYFLDELREKLNKRTIILIYSILNEIVVRFTEIIPLILIGNNQIHN